MRTETSIVPTSLFLNRESAIKARLSDHNVVIRGRTLFFNMMMQGRWNEAKSRYNNGFAKIETDKAYQTRIKYTVRLLAETLHMNPHIMFIGLTEAPIRSSDIALMTEEASKHPSLSGFMPSFTTSHFSAMGVATFINHQYFSVTAIKLRFDDDYRSLNNRVQKFELVARDNTEQLQLVNLHLPYDIAKSKDPTKLLKFSKSLFSQHTTLPVLVMGDFNIHPKKIADTLTGIESFIQKDNNILVRADSQGAILDTEHDTVDSIFQSEALQHKSRPYRDSRNQPDTSYKLLLEHRLFSRLLKTISRPTTKEELTVSIPRASAGARRLDV
ncbi:MAG: hypothetical protein P1U63_03840 [Coxiellaceae bacterium]|nr:hypothetical protein [Coxiellaceae bacterium]